MFIVVLKNGPPLKIDADHMDLEGSVVRLFAGDKGPVAFIPLEGASAVYESEDAEPTA